MIAQKCSPSPTRVVEYLLSALLIGWSLTLLLLPNPTMSSTVYLYFTALMPDHAWGVTGTIIGTLRIIGVYVNGNWRRTPLIRFIGAITGTIWWGAVTGLFWLATLTGATPGFPMLGGYPVLMAFEMYSCYRCGQDARAMNSLASNKTLRANAAVAANA